MNFIKIIDIGPIRLSARNRRRLKAETGHIYRECDETDGALDHFQIGIRRFSLSLTIFKGVWSKR